MTSDSRASARTWLLWSLLAVVVIIAMAAVLFAQDDPSTAAGVLTGGGLVVVVGLVGGWRARKRADVAGTASRVFGGASDERDRAVHSGAAAVTGIAALGLTAFGSLAVTLGLDAGTVVRWLPFLLIVTFAGAFLVINRRI